MDYQKRSEEAWKTVIPSLQQTQRTPIPADENGAVENPFDSGLLVNDI